MILRSWLFLVLFVALAHCSFFSFYKGRKTKSSEDGQLNVVEKLMNRMERRRFSLVKQSSDDDDDDEVQEFIARTLEKLANLLGLSNVARNLRIGVRSKAYCITCKIILTIIKSDIKKETLGKAFIKACIRLKVQQPDICTGVINSFLDDVDYIRKNSRLSRSEMCDLLLGLQCFKTNSENTLWEIEIPAKTVRSRSGRNYRTSSFVQITDNHLDFDYSPGSRADCGRPLCCQKDEQPKDGEKPAGQWADYRSCDVKTEVFNNAVEQARKHKNIDFWLWTGDVAPHTVWKITRQDVYDYIYVSTRVFMRNKVQKVYPVLGNHEGVPVNNFPPPGLGNELDISWLYNYAADQWRSFLSQEALETFRRAGNYKEVINPGTILLVVNSNYCARLNLWIFFEPVDAGDQLKWLAEELYKAESQNQRAHIAMHIPPDNRECIQSWTHNYLRIVERFSDIIIGQYFGHTHHDEIRILYSLQNESFPMGVQYIAPAVTTYSKTNPAYRVYHTVDGFIKDYETYWLNLTEANSGKLNWKLEYSVKQDTGLINLSPISWHHLIEKAELNPNVMDKFFEYYYTSSELGQGQCNSECRALKLEDQRVRHPIRNPAKGIDF